MQFAGKIKALFLHFFEWRYEMRIAYVRVSTEEQNEARQREALKQYRIEKWFCEKRSAKDTNRPQLEAMLEFARSGDTIYIHDFSRLARNTQDLLRLVQRMQQKEIQLISCQEQIDTATATGKLMLTMIAAINEFERSILLERQKEGIAIAKAEGKYKGRQPIAVDEEIFKRECSLWRSGQITATEAMKRLNLKPNTFYRRVKEMGL